MNTTNTLAKNTSAWPGVNPMWDAWQSIFRTAPAQLVQPILPGWSLNINSNNSGSPQTEADVVAEVSYGRQLGRISDALKQLIVAQHGARPSEPAFKAFLTMVDQIDALKVASGRKRLDTLKTDLVQLKQEDAKAYERLKKELLDLLSA